MMRILLIQQQLLWKIGIGFLFILVSRRYIILKWNTIFFVQFTLKTALNLYSRVNDLSFDV